MIGYNNCSNVHLALDETSLDVSQSGQFCVAGEIEESPSKILFVIDKSGSNADNLTASPVYHGNDPQLQKRIGSITLFFNAHKSQSNLKWGLISFQGTTAKSYIIDPANLNRPRFGNAAEFTAALAQFTSEQDRDQTPYIAAIKTAKDMISDDLSAAQTANQQTSLYNIVFMSDGQPTDFDPMGNGAPADSRHFAAVTELVNLSSGNIHFHTVYYTESENDPSRLNAGGLNSMASAGSGKFVDLSVGNTVNIDELMSHAEHKAWMLRHFQVYNLNSAMCDDGTIGVDSDSDGLCDQDEIRYNTLFAKQLTDPIYGGKKFDPLNRNSLKADYSDYFVLKKMILTNAVSLPTCTTGLLDTDHDLITDCEEGLMIAGNPAGRTTAWTSNLITAGGRGDSKNPDTDGDGFTDAVELFGTGLLSSSVNFNNILETVANGVEGYDLLYKHRHPKDPGTDSDATYDIDVRPTGFNERGDNCYSYSQRKLKLYPTQALNDPAKLSGITQLQHGAGENVILMYYLTAKEDDPNGREVSYRSHYQKLTLGSEGTESNKLKLDDFDLYKVPVP